MAFCCWFNDGIFLVIHSPNFLIFWTFDFCIILSTVFWRFFSSEYMASSKDRCVSLEDVAAFVTADADSDFISDFREEEKESSEREIKVDHEKRSTKPKRWRTRGGLHRRIRTRGGQNRVNNFR